MAPSLHLALVTETYAPEINGVALTLGRIVDGAARRGHRITIIRPRQRHESPRYTVTHRLACKHVRLPGIPLPGYPQFRLGLPAGGRLGHLWRRDRPDLVHVATEGPLGASAITAARRAGIPVTSSFHTNFDQYTRDYRIGWLEPLVGAWLRRVHNRTLRTYVPTEDLRVRLETSGYRNLRILSRGVDAAQFNPARRDDGLRAAWGAGPRDPVVIHVGRMAAEKNYPLVFRAFAAAREFVHPGRSGLTCAPGDEDAFLAQARRLADDDALRRELGATARKEALRWSWDTVIDGFLHDLTAAVAEHRRSVPVPVVQPSPSVP